MDKGDIWWKGDFTVFTSLDGDFTVIENFEQTLKATQKRLLLSSPWLGKSFVDILRRTLRNGMDIKVLTRVAKENGENTVNAIKALQSIAPYHEWKLEVNCSSKFHPKFIVVDESCCLAGSINPTEAGMYYNYEMGFVIRDPNTVCKVSDFFFDMWQRSVSWENEVAFHGFEKRDSSSEKHEIAERIMGMFHDGIELSTWKITNSIKNMGYAENDITEVLNYLIDKGKLYERRTDVLCLTPNNKNLEFWM